MTKNQKISSNTTKKRPSSTKPIAQVAPPVKPVQVATLPKKGFHINWKEINLWQFIILFSLPLLFTGIAIFHILDGLHHIRPEVIIISDPIVAFITFLLTVISAGLFAIKKINPFHPTKYKPKQVRYAVVSGGLLSIILIILAIPWPVPQSVSQAKLSPIPFPPYKGVLVLDGMQSKSSSKYFWEQDTQSQHSCKFVGSAYHVTATKQAGLEFCEAPNTNFRNFAFEIDMSFIKLGSAIILFRDNGQVSYQLDIKSFGSHAELSLNTFSFSKNKELSTVALIQPFPIMDGYQGPVDFSPGSTNHIGIVANNDTINMYVNGKTMEAWQVNDDSSSQGAIGVGVFASPSQDNLQTEVEFSNAKVWQL